MLFMDSEDRRPGHLFVCRGIAWAGAASAAALAFSIFGVQPALADDYKSSENQAEASGKVEPKKGDQKQIERKKFDFKKLFNGKDFTGWKIPEGNEQLGHWRVEDGEIVCQNDPTKKGTTLWTQAEYEDFVFVTDFKMGATGTIDSGVFLRTKNQQIQIGISGSLKRDMTGSIYVPGKGYPGRAEGVEDLLKTTDWNTMRIRAVGNVYTVWLNKKKILVYEEDEKAVDRGPIGLQLHAGKEMSVQFRKLRVAELDG